jgi:hypothetical protein
MSKSVDIQEFARRVETLCDFLIDKADRNGSDDLRVIQDLKEDAADIHMNKTMVNVTLEGLSNYMKGANVS